MAAFNMLVHLATISSCLAANFVMFPMFGRSHYMIFSRLGQELVERGHQVKIFVGASQNYAANDPNVRVFNDVNFLPLIKAPIPSFQEVKALGAIGEWGMLLKFVSIYCDDMINDAAAMDEISHADLVIGELIYLCSSLVADKYSLPQVIISSETLDIPSAFALSLPAPPSYVPQFRAYLTDEMTFLERASNLWDWLLLYVSYIHDLCPAYDEIKTKHNITPGKNIQETLGKVDMIIAQMHFTLEHPRPLYPNTRVVGPFLPSPAKALPKELDQFIQKVGDEGVILVSFGTVVGALDESWLQMMAETFSRLPQKVIWKLKLEDTSKISVSDNIKLLSWIPQNDILGHPKTRLFIAHAGVNGMLESTYHGVPMICSPYFGDQPHNAWTAKKAGLAEVVNVDTTSTEEFVSLIQKVLTQPSYRETAARISKSVQQSPRSPVKEAADWVEYTQAQGGLQYLRPRGLDLPFYKLYLLDILFVAFLAIVVFLLVIRFLLKSVIRCLSASAKKEKSN